MIKKLIKQLLCKHEYHFARNIYGDEINYCGGHRSWWRCKKCGKLQGRDYLYNEENINCQTFH